MLVEWILMALLASPRMVVAPPSSLLALLRVGLWPVLAAPVLVSLIDGGRRRCVEPAPPAHQPWSATVPAVVPAILPNTDPETRPLPLYN
jgi:hypothetical protein